MDFARGETLLVDGHAYEKTRVGQIAFERRTVGMKRKTYVRLSGGVGHVYRHGLGKPRKGRLQITHSGTCRDIRECEFLLMLRKFTGNRVEHGKDFVCLRPADLADVGTVKRKNVPLRGIDGGEVPTGGEFRNRLRHAANDQILTE